MGVTFLAPWVLAASAACALVVVALHLLAVGPPPEAPLPTARFVPARRARAMRRASRPSDLALLVLRALALLLAGAAFAGPRLVGDRRPVARLLLVDRSRAVADARAVMDSVLALARPGDLLIAFDSAAAAPIALGERAIDSVRRSRPTGAGGARGSLSAALAAGLRAAPALRASADSIELVVVSPVAAEEIDAASERLRALWTGRARVVRVAAAARDSLPARVDVRLARADVPDVLAEAAALAGLRGAGASVRVVRDGIREPDAAWVRDSARVLVDWPRDGPPAGWAARAMPDTVGGMTAGGAGGAGGGATFVAPMVRSAVAPADSMARPVAWWVDGAVAAAETRAGAGCVRTVAVPVPQAGDAALGPAFARLLHALAAPCGGATALRQDDAAWLTAAGPLRAARTLAEPADARTALPAWLLGAALSLLALEPLLRRARPTEADA